MKQNQKDKFAKALGIPKEIQDILDAGSGHEFNCRCPNCLKWWLAVGPEDGEDKPGNWGPFTQEEIHAAQQPQQKIAQSSSGIHSYHTFEKDATPMPKYKNVLEPERSKEFVEWKAKGFGVVVSPPNVLQIDFDSFDNMNKMFKIQKEFEEIMDWKIAERFLLPSKTEWHFHLYLKFEQKFENVNKPWYQTMLGSDPVRERISYYRIAKGIEHPIVFLEQNVEVIPKWAIQELI